MVEDISQAIALIRAGQKEEAQRFLVSLLQTDPKNEAAWLWLAETLPSDMLRISALEQCLEHIPGSKPARMALEVLKARQTPLTPEPEIRSRLALFGLGRQTSGQSSAPPEETQPKSASQSEAEPAPDIQPVTVPEPQASVELPVEEVPPSAGDGIDQRLAWLDEQKGDTWQEGVAPESQAEPLPAEAGLESRLESLEQEKQSWWTPATPQAEAQAPASGSELDDWFGRLGQAEPAAASEEAPLPADHGIASRMEQRAQAPAAPLPEPAASPVQPAPKPAAVKKTAAPLLTPQLTHMPEAPQPSRMRAHPLEIFLVILLVVVALVVVGLLGWTLLHPPAAPLPTPTGTSTLPLLPTATASPAPTATRTPLPTPTLTPIPTIAQMVLLDSFTAGSGPLTSVAFSPDGSLFAVGSQDGVVYFFDTFTHEQVAYHQQSSPVLALAFSWDSPLLAEAYQDSRIILWDTANQEIIKTLKGHTGPVTSLDFDPINAYLASGGEDGLARLWDTGTGEAVKTLSKPGEKIYSVAFLPGGGLFVGGSFFSIWDYSGDGEPRIFTPQGQVYKIAVRLFSQEGENPVSAGTALESWDMDTASRRLLYQGHTGIVWAVAYSPDNEHSLLASAGEDTTVRLWDPDTGAALQTLEEHQAPVRSVAFSPDGSRLVSVDDDGRVILWSTTTSQAEIPATHRNSPVDDMLQIYIPGGEFIMGADDLQDVPDSVKFFRPEHVVYLDAFWMDETEVTNGQYALCVAAGVCSPPGEMGSYESDHYYDDPQYANHPVVFIAWGQASTYCEWAGRRLPTEAEWEKAARGTDGRRYPWGNDPSPVAHPELDFVDVHRFPQEASPYGVLNLDNWVHEWTADWFTPDYYTTSPDHNPTGPAQPVAPGFRVERNDAIYRDGTLDSTQDIAIGFRCAETGGGR